MGADEKKSRQDEQMVTRRRMLKTLGITAGTVAASVVIPGKWIKPIVDVGVLPAHAQMSSCPYTIRLEVLDSNIGNAIPSGGTGIPENVDVVFTVSPNPGSGYPITWNRVVDGVPSSPTTGTNAAGVSRWDDWGFGGQGAGTVETYSGTDGCATSNTWERTVIGT